MEPNTLGNIIYTKDKENNLSIRGNKSYLPENYYFNDFYDERETTRFIKSIERSIRHSDEYNGYIRLLHQNIGYMNVDNILSNISQNDASIEMHHYPFSLYEIVDIVLHEHLLSQKRINSFLMTEEILEEHFANHIGLVPLSITTHELAHDKKIIIYKKQIFGDWEKFIEKYNSGLTANMKKRIKQLNDNENSENIQISDIEGLLDV